MEKKKLTPTSGGKPGGGSAKKRRKMGRIVLIATAAASFCAGFAAGFLLSPVKNGVLTGQQNYFTYTDGEGKLPEAVARAIGATVKDVTVLPAEEAGKDQSAE